MILLISTCKYSLSEEEFVEPIAAIVRETGCKYSIRRYYEKVNFSEFDKIIICGTALKDFNYLKYLSNFKPLLSYSGKVLGICAGYHILAKIHGASLSEVEKIGVYEVKVVKENPLLDKKVVRAYFLHTLALTEANSSLEPIAFQDREICMFRVRGKDFYGTAFYPEVLNKEVIVKFIELK